MLLSHLLCHYGFLMLIKISVCLPSHLIWWGETSDRTILEQPCQKRQSDFRLKSQAGCSEYVTQVVQTTNSSRIYQGARAHLVVFRSGTSTLAPSGSLLNLMIYAQTNTSTHMLFGDAWQVVQFPWKLWISNCLLVSELFVMSIIPRNDDSNFCSQIFILICNNSCGINCSQWCLLTVFSHLNVAFLKLWVRKQK